MNNRLRKNMKRWEKEIKFLEIVRDSMAKYIQLKEEKGDKDEIDKCNAKLTAIIENNSWMKLNWKEINRSKSKRAEGLEKTDKKLKDRRKKLQEGEETLAEEVKIDEDGRIITEGEDGEYCEEECREGCIYYHWIYGKMEVIFMEGNYVYLRLLDKKGVRSPWQGKNNVVVEVDGKSEEMKEFSLYSIGRWLFSREKDVEVPEEKKAHRMFV